MWTRCFCALVLLAPSLCDAQTSPTSQPLDEATRLVADGQYLKAQESLTRLISQASDAGSGPANPYRAGLYELLAITQNSLGLHAEAQRTAEQGVALMQQSQPAAADVLVSLLVSLAGAHTAQAHFRESGQVLARAMTIGKAGLTPDHPRLAAVFDGLGLLYLAQGQPSRAERSFRSGLEILEKCLGPMNPQTASVRLNLASILIQMGRQTEAVALIERSRKGFEQKYGPNHPDTIYAAYYLGVAQIASAPAEAEKVLRAAMADWLAAQPERHFFTASLLRAISEVRFRQGDTGEAIALDARVLEILREVLGPAHPLLVGAMYDRARLLASAKRKREAAALTVEADRIRIANGYSEPGRHTVDVHTLRRR